MKRLVEVFLILCLIGANRSNAQNLVVDGSFEEMECPENPINSVSETPTWYAINSDFYYISEKCPLDQTVTGNVNALNQPVTAQDGVAFASLEAGLTTNGFFSSEGTGIELTESLEEGTFYYLEMQTIHYPEIMGPDFPDEGCEPMPTRFMNVYFSSDKINISPETVFTPDGILTTGITSNAQLKLTDSAPNIDGFRTNQWNEFWNCFEGEGFEKHMAITGTFGKTTDTIDCIIEEQPGRIYFGGHAIDNVKLYKIPQSIDSTYIICEEGVTVHLEDIVVGPFFDKATYLWSDGSEEISRYLDQSGLYEIEMILPCVVVPIKLEINKTTCLADIFVGNVFSPNGDGTNDVLSVSVDSPYSLQSFRFDIFNRWGQLVYTSNSTDDSWNGTVDQNDAAIGVYTWLITYTLDVGPNQEIHLAGDVLLVR